jgi:hypothetical protein
MLKAVENSGSSRPSSRRFIREPNVRTQHSPRAGRTARYTTVSYTHRNGFITPSPSFLVRRGCSRCVHGHVIFLLPRYIDSMSVAPPSGHSPRHGTEYVPPSCPHRLDSHLQQILQTIPANEFPIRQPGLVSADVRRFRDEGSQWVLEDTSTA